MKKLIYYLPLFFIAMAIQLASCKKDFGSNNPNPPSTADEELSKDQLIEEEALTRSLDSAIRNAPDSIEGLHVFRKNPIPYVPIPMVDRNGMPIAPNTILPMENGTKITAKAFFDRLNSIKRWANGNGISIRGNNPEIASETVTEKDSLDNMTEKLPESSSKYLLSEKEQEVLMKQKQQVGDLPIMPLSEYTPEELKIIEGYEFKSSGDDNLTASRRSAPITNNAILRNSSVLLKEIDLTTAKNITKGKEKTLKVVIDGKIIRKAKIYPYDPQNPNASLSNYNVIGNGTISGFVFGKSVNLLYGNVSVSSPNSSQKNMTAKINIKIGGINVLIFDKKYMSRVVLSGDKWVQINKAVNISVPIFWGLTFTGIVNLQGKVGFKYGATLNFANVKANTTPYSSLKGYVEAGASFLGILGAGVGSNLIFAESQLPMRGSIYVTVQNANQIVVRSTHYFGYDLTILKGRLYAYIKACIPWKCWNLVSHNFFSWAGYTMLGTFSQGSNNYVVQNQ